MNSSVPHRLPQLDVLRFLAIFLVIGNHLPLCPPELNFILFKVTEVWNRGGWIGVDLFFVLSGFLVSGLLFREYQKTETLDFKKFLIRRGFKIYPPFWALIIVTAFVTHFVFDSFDKNNFIGEILFIQNYYANYWQHTWSLAVEEHFYLFLCLVFFLLLKFKKFPFESLPRIFVFVAIACFSMRFATAVWKNYSYETIIEPTHLRLDSLFFGVLISYFWHFKNLGESKFLQNNRFKLGIAGVFFLVPPFIYEINSHFWIGVLGVTFFYLGSGLLLITFLKLDFSNNRILLFLATIGTYSYSIYLWNMPTQFWIFSFLESNYKNYDWRLFALPYFFGTFFIGIAMSKLIEYPILKIRDKYFPSKNSSIFKT